jgi:hypothetical protein
MPKTPTIDAADRDLLEELVAWWDEFEKPVSVGNVDAWTVLYHQGFVYLDRSTRVAHPTERGISYIRRSRGHRVAK